jgi:hypothetical protein
MRFYTPRSDVSEVQRPSAQSVERIRSTPRSRNDDELALNVLEAALIESCLPADRRWRGGRLSANYSVRYFVKSIGTRVQFHHLVARVYTVVV